jgi:hypothetical protein
MCYIEFMLLDCILGKNGHRDRDIERKILKKDQVPNEKEKKVRMKLKLKKKLQNKDEII